MKKKIIFSSLFILTSLVGCYEEALYENQQFIFDDLVQKVVIEKTDILANGEDKSLVSIFFDTEENTNLIDFKAFLSKGTFLENGKDSLSIQPTFQTNNKGEVQKVINFSIVAPIDTGKSKLILSLNSFLKEFNFSFIRNFPNSVEIVPKPSVINRKEISNVELIVKLSSASGLPTHGSFIFLSAVDSSQSSIGRFLSQCSFQEDNQNCTALFTIWPDTSYVGEITIQGKWFSGKDTLINTINIFTLK